MTTRRVVEPGASAAVVRRLLTDHPSDALDEAPITVDQTNTSVVVGGRAIVKWLDPPVPHPHPGVAILAHLGAVGFTRTPALLGVEVVDGYVDAIVTRYHPGAVDGWTWYIDEAQAWVVGDADLSTVEARGAQLGRLTAELHVALATPSAVLPSPVGRASIAPAQARGSALLAEALAVTSGDAHQLLRGLESRIRAEIARFVDPDGEDVAGSVAVQPIHGDLHVGQILLVGDELLVIDFDGDPVAPPDERHRHQPTARDVAALLQSIDHVARVVDARLDGARAARVEAFIAAATGAALAAHRSRLAELGHPDDLDERLLRPYRVVQELHELVYAVRHLPVWSYVPEAALPALFTPDGDD